MDNSSDLDTALANYLKADAPLMALLPDGVFIDEAPQNATRFVLITLTDHADAPQFGGRAFEDVRYWIRAIARSTAVEDLAAAESRLDAILEDGTLAVPGFMAMFREERFRRTVRDPFDGAVLWFQRGGFYRVQVAMTP